MPVDWNHLKEAEKKQDQKAKTKKKQYHHYAQFWIGMVEGKSITPVFKQRQDALKYDQEHPELREQLITYQRVKALQNHRCPECKNFGKVDKVSMSVVFYKCNFGHITKVPVVNSNG